LTANHQLVKEKALFSNNIKMTLKIMETLTENAAK